MVRSETVCPVLKKLGENGPMQLEQVGVLGLVCVHCEDRGYISSRITSFATIMLLLSGCEIMIRGPTSVYVLISPLENLSSEVWIFVQ